MLYIDWELEGQDYFEYKHVRVRLQDTNIILPIVWLTHLVSQVDISPGLDKHLAYSVTTPLCSYM